MIEAWFEPEQAKYVTLVALSALAALLGRFITKGKFRPLVYSVWIGLAGLGVLLLALMGLAYVQDQPAYVVSTLFKGGICLSVAFGISLVSVRRGYQEAEMNKITAHDL